MEPTHAIAYAAGMNLPLAASAARAALAACGTRSLAEWIGAAAVVFFAQVVAITVAAGLLGLLDPASLVVLSVALSVNVWFACAAIDRANRPAFSALSGLWSRPVPAETRADRLALAGIALALPIVAAVFVLGLAAWPPPYDAMTYHLHFPARWLQEGSVFVVPTPFGDPAAAYGPSNTELWFAWLIAPWESDWLARVGQFPLFLLSLIAIYGIARRLDLSRAVALSCAGLFAANPLVLAQAATAEVDLAMTAFFLAAVWFLLIYRERPDARTAAVTGCAAGLFLGTKYVAAVFVLPLAIGAAAVFLWPHRGRSTKAAAAHAALWCAGVLVCGGFWYVRNAVCFGSPVFPAGIWVGGYALFEGPVTRAAMMGSVFHLPAARWLPVVAAFATDPRAFVFLVILWAGGTAIAVRSRDGRRIAVAACAFALIGLWALAIPYNSQYRFLLPAVALAWITAGFALAAGRWVRFPATAAAVLSTALVLLATLPERTIAHQRYVASSLIHPGSLWLIAAAFAVLTAAFVLAARAGRLRWSGIALALGVVATGWLALSGSQIDAATGRPLRLGLSPPTSQPLESWAWVGAHLTDATIAYAGTNAPYLLAGPNLSNRAVYVNVDGRSGAKLHDYFRERLAAGDRPAPSDKPAFYRDGADRRRWLGGLFRAGATHLWVQAMGPDERRRLGHDPDGFPIERGWARSDPAHFQPVLVSPAVELYRIAYN